MLIYEDGTLLIKKLTLGLFETNTYILVCKASKESLVIDAPADLNTITDHLDGTIPQYILLTHDHIDHIGALDMLRTKLRVPLATHEYSSYQLEKPPELLLQDHDMADLGKLKIEVLFTPGHTPGSLCFRVENHLFAGDTLFPGGPGHTDTPENFKQIIKSITNKIYCLQDDTIILPGHGDETTVKQSKEEYAAFKTRFHNNQLCGDVTWQDS